MSQLSRSDVKNLAQILRIDSTERTADVGQIRYLVSHLPHDLRNSKLANLITESRHTANLCSKHQGMNPQIVWRLLNALQRQVMEGHFHLNRHLHMMNPDEAFTLHRIHALEGMWTLPAEARPSSPISPRWDYQANTCEACMLSRVGSNPGVLRDLRTIMLSRARNEANTAARARLRRPMASVLLHLFEELIMLTNRRDEIFYQSGQRSCAMRDAVRRSRQDHAGGHPDRSGSEYCTREHSGSALSSEGASRNADSSSQQSTIPILLREPYSVLEFSPSSSSSSLTSFTPMTTSANKFNPANSGRTALKMPEAFNTVADTEEEDLEADLETDPLHLSSTATSISQALTFGTLTDEYRSLVTLPSTCYDGSPVMLPSRWPPSPEETSWSELYTAAKYPPLPTHQVPSGKAVIHHV